MRNKKGNCRRGSLTIPIAPVAGLLGGLSMPIGTIRHGDIKRGIEETALVITGVDPATGKFNWTYVSKFWIPVGMGILGHYAASRLGINRLLGRAKVPVIRI